MEITPLSVTEELERVLSETTKKAGKPQGEILQLCLELGIQRILEGI
jgi:hypothetical protein